MMIHEHSKGIIELGNINIKCLVFKINSNDILEIQSTSITQSEGIHNGVIVNISKATNAIRSCISVAEKKAKSSLKKINGSKIHKDDIEFLLKEAKKQVMLNDEKQSIIHIFNHNYIVDGKPFIEEPIDVYADYLSHEMTFVTMPKNNLKNINKAFIDCDIEVERLISCTFALAAKLLNNNELQFGSILIDMGYEKTSLGLFKNLALVHSITFPIGINHIIKDISNICSLNLEESKIISDKIDFSFQNNKELFDKNDYLKDIYFKNSNYRRISQSLILDIAKARLDEIFEMIQKQIIATGLNPTLGANLFILGGSNLFNLEKYCSNFFGTNVKKLDKNIEKENQGKSDTQFASCLGALKIIKDGWETEAIPELVDKNSQKLGFFAKFFQNKP